MCVNLYVEAGYWNIKGLVPLRDLLVVNVLCFLRLSWYRVGGLWYRNGTAQKGGSL